MCVSINDVFKPFIISELKDPVSELKIYILKNNILDLKEVHLFESAVGNGKPRKGFSKVYVEIWECLENHWWKDKLKKIDMIAFNFLGPPIQKLLNPQFMRRSFFEEKIDFSKFSQILGVANLALKNNNLKYKIVPHATFKNYRLCYFDNEGVDQEQKLEYFENEEYLLAIKILNVVLGNG